MILFIIMIAYLIGIIWGLYINNIVSIFLFILILFIILMSNKIKEEIHLYKNVLFLIIFVLLVSFFNVRILEKSYQNKYNDLNENIKVEAIVVSNTIEKEYNNTYTIKIKCINDNQRYKNDLLILQIKNKQLKIDYGDEIYFIGNFKKAQTARNEGGFNYEEYLKTKKVYGIISTKIVKVTNKGGYNKFFIAINKIKLDIESKIDLLLEENEANLLKGFLVGDKEKLGPEIQQNFRDSSLSHLLAVSGAHVSYVILAITIALNYIKIHKKIKKITTIFLLVFFMILTGTTPSVVRACIMAIYIIFASIVYRKPNIINSLSLAFLITMISNPYKIFDIGFQLSFGGTIGILLFNKKIENLFNNDNLQENTSVNINNEKQAIKRITPKLTPKLTTKITKKISNYIKSIIIISLSANMIIIPIMLYHYNTLSLTFVISNLLSAPLFGIIVILGFVVVIISFVSFKFAKIISIFVSIFLKTIIQITKITSKLPFSKIYLPTPKIICLIIYYTIISLVIIKKSDVIGILKKTVNTFKTIIEKRTKYKKIISLTIVFILISNIILFLFFNAISSPLTINFIDVGQGDCTLITTPKNKKILIDGGGSESYDIGKNVVIPYLLDKGITKLDYIIISHFDTDHIRRSINNNGRVKSWTSYNLKTGTSI